MPIYEYQCRKCAKKFEHLARHAADYPAACPDCGAKKPARLLSGFSVGAPAAAPAMPSSCASCSGGSCPYGRK